MILKLSYLIKNVVPSLPHEVTGQFGSHNMSDLNIVGKYWLFPRYLQIIDQSFLADSTKFQTNNS